MLDIFVCKPLAPWTLRQAYVCATTSRALGRNMLLYIAVCHGGYRSCFLVAACVRRVLVRFVAAVEDVVKLWYGEAALNADWHAKCVGA